MVNRKITVKTAHGRSPSLRSCLASPPLDRWSASAEGTVMSQFKSMDSLYGPVESAKSSCRNNRGGVTQVIVAEVEFAGMIEPSDVPTN